MLLKFSIVLHSFVETVSTADKIITRIAKDVSPTAAVASELGRNLEQDRQGGFASENAMETSEAIVLECKKTFEDTDTRLGEGIIKRVNLDKYDNVRFAHDRPRWPILQPKMELLRNNLERLKSTLILMLHVLTYAAKSKQ